MQKERDFCTFRQQVPKVGQFQTYIHWPHLPPVCGPFAHFWPVFGYFYQKFDLDAKIKAKKTIFSLQKREFVELKSRVQIPCNLRSVPGPPASSLGGGREKGCTTPQT